MKLAGYRVVPDKEGRKCDFQLPDSTVPVGLSARGSRFQSAPAASLLPRQPVQRSTTFFRMFIAVPACSTFWQCWRKPNEARSGPPSNGSE